MGWASIIAAGYAGLFSTRVYANNSYSTGVICNLTRDNYFCFNTKSPLYGIKFSD